MTTATILAAWPCVPTATIRHHERMGPVGLADFVLLRLIAFRDQADADAREAPPGPEGDAARRRAQQVRLQVATGLQAARDYKRWQEVVEERGGIEPAAARSARKAVQRFATLFDDHPDYREEWRP